MIRSRINPDPTRQKFPDRTGQEARDDESCWQEKFIILGMRLFDLKLGPAEQTTSKEYFEKTEKKLNLPKINYKNMFILCKGLRFYETLEGISYKT